MFYFVFGINNSGTTVVCQYLAQQTGAYLPPFGFNEGQFAPAVKQIFRTRPWAEHKEIDWAFVRAEWEKLMRAEGKEAFIEGSPPNIMRVGDILAAFADGWRAAFLISDPYMQIASCLRNYADRPLTEDTVDQFCARWVRKARFQARNREEFPDIPLLTYEAFCADPEAANRIFGVPVRPDAKRVPGKRRRGRAEPVEIADRSARTIAFLRPGEVDRIAENLAREEALVTGLGYHVLDAAAMEARLAAEPELAEAGRGTRRRWEAAA